MLFFGNFFFLYKNGRTVRTSVINITGSNLIDEELFVLICLEKILGAWKASKLLDSQTQKAKLFIQKLVTTQIKDTEEQKWPATSPQ